MKHRKTGEEYFGPMDCQFTVAYYFLKDDGHYDCSWSGVDFDNTWKGAVDHAHKYVRRNPEMYCVISDRMGRKKDLRIFAPTKQTV